jgi:hypothetical protein
LAVKFIISFKGEEGRDSSVGIATGYGLDGPGLIPGSVKYFSSPDRPDRLWDPPSLLSNECMDLFLWVKATLA